jgi:hypothetical protein
MVRMLHGAGIEPQSQLYRLGLLSKGTKTAPHRGRLLDESRPDPAVELFCCIAVFPPSLWWKLPVHFDAV